MVQTNADGYPYLLLWDWFSGKQMIAEITDHWVVSDPWDDQWEKRDYYGVVTETGLALIIFLNGLTQAWYIQWVFD
ncbi:MAG: hypothetical protein LCI00_05650 [Chloroflexi bacterium]|nr:hypothetical protein [Chloroflexota bacterium]